MSSGCLWIETRLEGLRTALGGPPRRFWTRRRRVAKQRAGAMRTLDPSRTEKSALSATWPAVTLPALATAKTWMQKSSASTTLRTLRRRQPKADLLRTEATLRSACPGIRPGKARNPAAARPQSARAGAHPTSARPQSARARACRTHASSSCSHAGSSWAGLSSLRARTRGARRILPTQSQTDQPPSCSRRVMIAAWPSNGSDWPRQNSPHRLQHHLLEGYPRRAALHSFGMTPGSCPAERSDAFR